MGRVLLAIVLTLQGINSMQTPTGVVTGILRTSNGQPAVNVRVSAMRAADDTTGNASADVGALFSQAQTDESGRYRLESIPPGRYYIVAGRVDNPTYYPDRTGVEAATVSVLSGSPIEGIDFTVTDASMQRSASFGLASLLGHLTVPTILVPIRVTPEPGIRLPISSSSGSLALSVRTTGVPGSVSTMETALRAALQNMSSTAAGPRGNPPVTVSGTPVNPSIPIRDGAGLAFMAPGEYRIVLENLPDDYEVKTMSYDNTDLLQHPLKLSGGGSAIAIVVGLKNAPPAKSGRVVRGRMIDGLTGKPWVAESVRLSQLPGTLFSDGSFEFTGVARGRHTLEAVEGAPGNRTASERIVVEGTDLLTDLAYTSPPAAVTVSGRIVAPAGAVTTAGVTLEGTSTKISLLVAHDGTFKTALPGGTYAITVSVSPVGFALQSLTSGSTELPGRAVEIDPMKGPAADELVLTLAPLPRVTIRGRVVAVPPTRPVEGAPVALTGGPEAYRTNVAADGTFELRVLPGTYRLTVQPFGFTNVTDSVTAIVDQDLNLKYSSQPLY